jgi:hypothetical protein
MQASSKFQNYVRNDMPNCMCPAGQIKCSWRVGGTLLLKAPDTTIIQATYKAFLRHRLLGNLVGCLLKQTQQIGC